MRQEAIFYPVLVLVLHTFVVWCWMYVVRIRKAISESIPMSAFRDQRTAAATPGVQTTVSDNLVNLFELPVLFYMASVVLYVTSGVTGSVLAIGWFYVATRVAHSLVHITYNKVMHRFSIYIVGSIALWAIWIMIAARLL